MRRPFAAVVAALLVGVGCGEGVSTQPDADTTTPGSTATEVPTTGDAASTTTAPGRVEETLESTTSEPEDVLRRGHVGERVMELQQELVRHGFEIDVDGRFGPATEAAVGGFQFSHGLEADGVAGPDTWSMLNSADASSTVVLRDDGLTVADFGEPETVVMPILVDVLGAPGSDLSSDTTYACEQGVCEGRERTVRWRSVDDATFAVKFESTGDAPSLVGWELSGFGGGRGVVLATAGGVVLGSTTAEVVSAYPDADFGHSPEPSCGDAWWNPGAFEIDVDDDDPSTGLRGSVDHDWDVMLETLDEALIVHGIPEGLDCGEDVMCAEIFGRFQESVGLPLTGELDRPTWLALGLPLPPATDAAVQSLRAGRNVTEC